MNDPFANHRISLRPIEPEDRDALAAYLNEPEMRGLRQMDPDHLAPMSVKAIGEAVDRWSEQKHSLNLVVSPAGDDIVVGHVVSDWRWDAGSPFVGVAIAPRHRRRGYGSAAMDLALSILFTQTLAHMVQSWTPSWNEGGIAFLQGRGFSPAGAVRRAGRRDDSWYDELAFDLLKREWEGAR